MNHTANHGIRFGRIAAMLPVKDIVRAHDFYTKVLGFTKTFQNGDPVGFVILERDEAEVYLTLQPNHKAATFNVAHMMVGDADALHAICQRCGLRIIKSIQDKDYGGIPIRPGAAPTPGGPLTFPLASMTAIICAIAMSIAESPAAFPFASIAAIAGAVMFANSACAASTCAIVSAE
jgi:catechol 2,3-dioxygenase-like lactoylglutathione lyase family enzyme